VAIPARLVQGAFLAPALRAELERVASRERSADSERRRATILFADLSGFTAMTERLGAERAFPIVVAARDLLADVARRHGGTVEKYRRRLRDRALRRARGDRGRAARGGQRRHRDAAAAPRAER
jgi:hypothetical protein